MTPRSAKRVAALIDPTAPMPALTARVVALGNRPSDPAIALALVGLLRDPAYTGQKSKPLWKAVLAALRGKHADPASVAPLVALAVDYQKIFGPTVMGRLVEHGVREAATELAARFPDAPRTEAVVAAPAPRRGSVEDLSAQIAAQPDDDDLRDVLADALLERADLRGEFIALQMRAHRGAALSKQERAREAALIAAHDKAWLGPVADTTVKDSRVWRRGFLDVCELLPRGKFITRAVDHPAWATVRELVLKSYNDTKGLAIILASVLRRVRAITGASSEVVRAIASVERPWAIERLTGYLSEEGGVLPALLTSKALPALRELEMLEGDVGELRGLWKSPLARQLTLFRFTSDGATFADASSEVLAHAKLAVEVIVGSVLVRFDGKRLTVRPSGEARRTPDVAGLLTALPPGRFATIDIDPTLDTPAIAAAKARACARGGSR